MEETQEQLNNKKPWLFKKGQSGNPGGRPKGSISMKEYARKYLQELPEEEKMAFMEGLPKDVIWKMAEGNPKNESDIAIKELPIIHIAEEIANKNDISSNNSETHP